MMVRVLWLVVLVALAAAMRLPRVSDIYIKDIYVVVSRATAIVLILVVLVLPLLAFTLRVLRSSHN